MDVHHNAQDQRFELTIDGETARAEYRLEGNTIILTHTEVPPAHRGRGAGDALARAAFGYARDHDLRVVARCPFMAKWARKHRERTGEGTGRGMGGGAGNG